MSLTVIHRPTNCAICGAQFYTATHWHHGRLVYANSECGTCRQPDLFGGDPA